MNDLKTLFSLFTVMAFCSIKISAEEIESNTLYEDTEVTLTIKPYICIAPRGESSCISRIDVFWESNQETDVCLHVSVSAETLQCWEQSQTGMFQHRVTLLKNLDYWATSLNQQHLWAKSTVKFAALKPHRMHKRRRNNLPWSIQSF